MFRERLAAGLFFVLVMGVMPVAIGAVTAGLRIATWPRSAGCPDVV